MKKKSKNKKSDKAKGKIAAATKQLPLQKLLSDNYDKMKFLADSMPQKVWTADSKGVVDYFNNKWYEYTGMTFDDIGKGSYKAIHPDDIDITNKIWGKSIKTGKDFELEHRFRRADGQFRWHLSRGIAQRDSKGKILMWIGTNTDIHEQKLAEEKAYFLSEASRIISLSLDYKVTLNSIAKLLVPKMADWYAVDLLEEGEIKRISTVHVNPEKVKWALELSTKYPTHMDSPTGVPNVIKTDKSEFYPHITDEMLLSTIKDKKYLKIIRTIGFTSVMIVPLIARAKTIGALTLVTAESKRQYTKEDLEFAEDLARRIGSAVDNANLFKEAKEAERLIKRLNEKLEKRVEERTMQLIDTNEELEESNKQLLRSNQELEDFAYVASHDLQEPLRKITSFSNLLETNFKDLVSKESQDYLQIIQSASRRMSNLINDLLTYSRVTTQAKPFVIIDLNNIYDEVIDDLQVRIQQSKAKVTKTKLCIIQGDSLQIRLLFQNIISNAIKYTKKGEIPRVEVTSRDEGKNCIISVKDNGIGFEEKYLDRIFTIFQRLHGKGSYEGTGVGLAICKKIVERHNGKITASSKVGKGSTFIITLPKKQI